MVKTVCTIGPASDSEDSIKKLILAGMNVARLNFSHGTHEEHHHKILNIRKIASELGKPVAILQDLAGQKIRVGEVKNGSIKLKSGDRIKLTNRKVKGSKTEIPISYKDLPKYLSKNDTIMLSDGSMELKVLSTSKHDIECEVIIGGRLSSKKGVNIPSQSFDLPIFTSKDKEDLEFGIKNGINIVAMSFIRTAKDVKTIRDFMNKRNSNLPIIAKIENLEALKNIKSILETVDGIMVARGDLGVETPLEKIPIVQKDLILRANRAAKPVITATQMLKSMTDNIRPTRAEASDVANAILDGTDAVMLSEESAIGKYPSRAVKTISKIAKITESSDSFHSLMLKLRNTNPSDSTEAICLAACNLAFNSGASAIISLSETSLLPRYIAKYRPSQPILSITNDENTYQFLNIIWGVIPILVNEFDRLSEDQNFAIKICLNKGLIKSGEKVVFIHNKTVSLIDT